MRVGGKWNLLKHLLNESHSNSNKSQVISRVLHEGRQSETEDAIFEALTNKYLPIGTSSQADYPSYKRHSCLELNEPFTVNEVRDVLRNLNGRSAPKPRWHLQLGASKPERRLH
ncbi:hypothetical protein HPB47_015256 [Ixodes persulcatus]|uniref:Uncharacterized protein n=1 Tax=Ixodes persulcatus TaxID=34615 RepID=A0AC60QTZ5_IXOPE|nr:hypothetical protein HPB47_015256 [Ixodes persulcatus]